MGYSPSPSDTQPAAPVLRSQAEHDPWRMGGGSSLLKKLEQMEADLSISPSYTGHTRWMIPYADMLTLLLCFFLVLFGLSLKDPKHGADTVRRIAQTLQLPTKDQTSDVGKTAADPALQASRSAKEAFQEEMLAKRLSERLGTSDAIRIHRQERGIVITMKDNLLFETGKADITPTARKTLDSLSDVLKDFPNTVRVEGHTDNTPVHTPQFPSNWELSTARATRIVQYLVATHGLDPAKLSAIGYGEFRPIANNSTSRGKQKNRRVDIVVMNGTSSKLEPPVFPERPDASRSLSP